MPVAEGRATRLARIDSRIRWQTQERLDRQYKERQYDMAQEEKAKAKREAKAARKRSKLRNPKSQRGQPGAAEREMITAALARKAARAAEVERSEQFVASMWRGLTLDDDVWTDAFHERHGRKPTELEKRPAAQLAEERLALRASRHLLAEASLEVLDAERSLLVKERQRAIRRIQDWERERRKASTTGMVNLADRASNPLYRQLQRAERELENRLKRLDRQRRAARDREIAWPGMHFKQMAHVLNLPADDEATTSREGTARTGSSEVSLW